MMTCEMLYCCAKLMSASATFLSFQRDDLRAQIAGHAAILLDPLKGFRVSVPLVLVRPVYIDGVPVRRKAAGHAR